MTFGKLATITLALIGSLASMSSPAHAAPPVCVQNMLSGIGTSGFSFTGRPLKLVLHRHDSAWVGYGETPTTACSTAGLGNDNATTASAELLFEFSDRFSGSQNFTNTSTEWGDISVNRSTGAITVHLFGGASFGPVVPTCVGNVITFSTNSMEFWSLSFGPLRRFVGCF